MNEHSETNMWHMDGQFPSAFTDSTYEIPTTTKTPTFAPKSLADIFLVSHGNLGTFMSYLLNNIWTLFWWGLI
jgi:hypothetical protein